MSFNGNSDAVAIAPRALFGRSLVHRHLSKRQRACLAADVLDEGLRFKPSTRQLSVVFGVSVPYIDRARKLSAARRDEILSGRDVTTSFVAKSHASRLPRLGSNGGCSISDAELLNVARLVGVDRMLTAAAAAEHHHAA
jgi:hypothetical protein